ncbi:hypothetical protein QJS04_geneDACA009853 [Acorus gramineus]|uniref:Uncharacterized protein n=1 Tax=Acorus gramineus TaxID=55184 RepID=A0AAV9B7U2_ACOGR|nr:hypothetical protein QJS04_geneDACA009853 [Acorus gramineus]
MSVCGRTLAVCIDSMSDTVMTWHGSHYLRQQPFLWVPHGSENCRGIPFQKK